MVSGKDNKKGIFIYTHMEPKHQNLMRPTDYGMQYFDSVLLNSLI